ncbi:unnamed protein product, partial [Amoebophrya sp. A120]
VIEHLQHNPVRVVLSPAAGNDLQHPPPPWPDMAQNGTSTSGPLQMHHLPTPEASEAVGSHDLSLQQLAYNTT